MKFSRHMVTFACALVALAAAAPAQADLVVGAADNRPKLLPDQAERFYDTMKHVGLTENRISVEWDSAQPTTIGEEQELRQAIDLAAARGVTVTLAVYPKRARTITGSPAARGQFIAFMAQVARAYPQVKHFIVGNEPNKATFWQPQFNPNRTRAACKAYEPVLAAAYDALKAVDPAITVIGVGLGARGNDNPRASGNLSISPVRCIHDIGRAYRASRRTRPIMDELSYHPYPQNSSHPLEAGYRWPNAGVTNLARIKQAVWDAFRGTRQPVFQEPGAPLRTLKFRLNEVGWEVSIPPASRFAYHGTEKVVTTDEGTQAAIYANLIPLLACDTSVRSMLFFNFVDEANLDRWQSGLLRADWTLRPSYNIVRSAIAARTNRCARRPVVWRHAVKVIQPRARFGDMNRIRDVRATSWSFPAGADEGVHFSAGIYKATKRGALTAGEHAKVVRGLRAGRPRGAALSVRGLLPGGWERVVRFKKQRLKPGYYVYAIRLAAEMNPARTATLVSRAFRVGEPGAEKPKQKATPVAPTTG